VDTVDFSDVLFYFTKKHDLVNSDCFATLMAEINVLSGKHDFLDR